MALRRLSGRALPVRNTSPCGAQYGQGMVLGLVAASAAGIMLVMVYNVGQVALTRSRLTQATDAAAYSGALVQARTLNMLAHVQRTQVGHQVALAHLVTLGAWAQFADAQHTSHQRGNPPGMIIGRFFGPLHRRAYGQSKALASGTQTVLARAIRGHNSATHVTLAKVARALVQGLPNARAAAIDQVLAANLPPSAAVGPAVQWTITNDDWASVLVRRSASAADPLADMIKRSVQPYGFLSKRHRTAYNPWSINPACPWMLHTLARRGATWMDDTGRWQAVDTQSFQARRFNRHIGCYYREYAMGWGAVRGSPARASASPDQDLPDLSKEAYWRWARRATRWDLRLAENRVAGLRAMMRAWAPPQRGLTPWYDISEHGRLSTTFELAVRQDASTIATSDQPTSRFLPVGWFRFLGLGDRPLRVRAAAQSYFSPERRPSAASVFRPQWRARLSPTRGDGGQALIEMTVALILLLTLAGAALVMGEQIQEHLEDDQTSRWLAFTALPGGAAATLTSTLASTSISTSTPLASPAQPGGVTPEANDMRRAWAYADQGLVSAQVGRRTTVVARDAGHHHDHRATQSRLAQSQSAWRGANEVSQQVARKIEAQAGRADDGWQRPAPSLDWLTPWSPQDIRRRQRPRGAIGYRRERGRTRKPRRLSVPAWTVGLLTQRSARRSLLTTRRHGAPARPVCSRKTVIAGTCRFSRRVLALILPLIGLCPPAAAVCAVPGVEHAAEDVAQVSRREVSLSEASWQQAITGLTELAHAVDTTVGTTSTRAVDGFFWFGIPVASKRFSFDLPVSPGVGGAGASVAQVLSATQPALKDIAIVDDRFLLAGFGNHTHWLAQWEETATQARGTLSAMRLAHPVFDIAAPRWLGPNAQVVTHLLYPDTSLLSVAGQQARRSGDARPGRRMSVASAWSSASAWRVEGDADSVTLRIGQDLRREGWEASTDGLTGSLPSIDVWVKGNCTLTTQILDDASAAHASQVWLRSTGRLP